MLLDDPYAQDVYDAWAAAQLSYKLDDHQLNQYTHYREWEPRALDDRRNGIARCYMFDAGRRVGKTFDTSTIKVEDALREPNSTHLFASATEIGLKELVIPILRTVISDAPEEFRPQFFTSRWGMRAGFFFPSSDSVIKLVGIDNDPDSLRGPGLNGAAITEAAFVDKLAYVVNSVIYPQFQRKPLARIILESSAPVDPDHDFDLVFLPDCKARRAYYFMTIDDNTAISQEEKEEFVEAARRIDPDDAEREYYGKRVRNRQRVVIPEFTPALHVRESVRPNYAIAMAAMDPGMRDLLALLWGYWDFDRAKLVVERDFCERNASTATVADVIRKVEAELYGEFNGFQRRLPAAGGAGKRYAYFDGEWRTNPVQRVSDTEARTIGDMCTDHKIGFVNTFKDDKEAAINSVRFGFRENRIEIHPRCVDLANHVFHARWNEHRTDYERTPRMGHYDLLDALVYLWRMIQPYRAQDPKPPSYLDRADTNVLFHQPLNPHSQINRGLEDAFASSRGRKSWR